MGPFSHELSDTETLLDLAPEELAAHLLALLPAAEQNGVFQWDAIASWFYPNGPAVPEIERRFPRSREKELGLAFSEAMNWLSTQSLIVPAEGMNGANGFMRLTRRGRAMSKDKTQLEQYRKLLRFPKELLFPSIANKVSLSLIRGELDDAVFAAFKA